MTIPSPKMIKCHLLMCIRTHASRLLEFYREKVKPVFSRRSASPQERIEGELWGVLRKLIVALIFVVVISACVYWKLQNWFDARIIESSGKQRWTYFLTAGVPIIGGLMTLTAATLAGFVALRQFEVKRQDDRYFDALNRFADPNNATGRADAALRLKEMSLTSFPGQRISNYDARSYSRYSDIASHLVRALHMEEEEKVRDAISAAIQLMGAFGAKHATQEQRQKNDPLNYSFFRLLIHYLEDANQNTYVHLIHALAAYEALSPRPSKNTPEPLKAHDDLILKVLSLVFSENVHQDVLLTMRLRTYLKSVQF